MAPIREPDVPARTLTAPELAQWAIQGGFKGDDVATAVAVALAESSGKTQAKHAVGDGSYDLGPWQINSHWHADLLAKYPAWWSVDNAVMAFTVKTQSARGWGDWTTYRTGAYLLYLPQAKAAAANPSQSNVVTPGPGDLIQQNPLTGPITEVANAIKGASQAVFKAGSWLSNRENIIRVAQVGFGGALLVGALVIVGRSTIENVAGSTVSKIVKGAGK